MLGTNDCNGISLKTLGDLETSVAYNSGVLLLSGIDFKRSLYP